MSEYFTPQGDTVVVEDLYYKSDEDGSYALYRGVSRNGTLDYMPLWSICRIYCQPIGDTVKETVTWAHGLKLPCNIWNERAQLPYRSEAN